MLQITGQPGPWSSNLRMSHTIKLLLGHNSRHRHCGRRHIVLSRVRLHNGRGSAKSTSDICSLGTVDVYSGHSTTTSGMSYEPAPMTNIKRLLHRPQQCCQLTPRTTEQQLRFCILLDPKIDHFGPQY